MTLTWTKYIFVVVAVAQVRSEFTEHRTEVLDGNNSYQLEWWLDYEAKIVQFNVTVETQGWVGFGVSSTGGMKGADIVIGGVHPNGTLYFSDRHAVGNSQPVLDDKQDWTLISASATNTHTNLLISRPFDTCDDQDIILSSDTTNFIWAYSDSNSDELSYHSSSNRGTLTVQPLDPQMPPVDLQKFLTYPILTHMTMPSNETTYWCSIHKSPTFLKKHHIVAFQPELRTPEAVAHTHHYNIYRCTAPEGFTAEEYFEPFVGKEGGECYVPEPKVPSKYCQTMFYNWAVGGRSLILPEEIGYPIGETGSPVDYYMFEIHYNNPDLLEGVVFETGVTVYYTDELRKEDAGLMVVAHHTSISLTIPPDSTDFQIVGHCDSSCTSSYLPEDGINVFAVFLHAHISGRKMKFRHFRGDKELPWAAQDDTYDFEFQQTRPLPKELKVLPGDHLTMECTYDTTWNNGKVVIGGLSTKEEMCQAIFWHYPRAELRDCRSEYPLEKLFQKFGIESAENRSSPYDDAIITAPEKWKGMKYSEVLNGAVNWNEDLRIEMQNDLVQFPHEGTCYTVSGSELVEGSTGYPEINGEYTPTRECPKDQDSSTSLVKDNISLNLLLLLLFPSLIPVLF